MAEFNAHVFCTDPEKSKKILVVFTEKGYLVAQLHINPYLNNRVFVELQDFSCNSKTTAIYQDGVALGQNVSQLTPWLDICREHLPEALRGLL
jgi:hypothetical protein